MWPAMSQLVAVQSANVAGGICTNLPVVSEHLQSSLGCVPVSSFGMQRLSHGV